MIIGGAPMPGVDSSAEQHRLEHEVKEIWKSIEGKTREKASSKGKRKMRLEKDILQLMQEAATIDMRIAQIEALQAETDAATRIQSVIRGKAGRKEAHRLQYSTPGSLSLRLPKVPLIERGRYLTPQPPNATRTPHMSAVWKRPSAERDYRRGTSRRPLVDPIAHSSRGHYPLAETQRLAEIKWREEMSRSYALTERTRPTPSSDSPVPMTGGPPLLWRTHKWRERFALREGRVIQDDRYHEKLKESRRDRRLGPVLPGQPTGLPLKDEMNHWNSHIQSWQRSRRQKQNKLKRDYLALQRAELRRLAWLENQMYPLENP